MPFVSTLASSRLKSYTLILQYLNHKIHHSLPQSCAMLSFVHLCTDGMEGGKDRRKKKKPPSEHRFSLTLLQPNSPSLLHLHLLFYRNHLQLKETDISLSNGTQDTFHSESLFSSCARTNMMPWRPLGMLTFGLTIIFLFVRLHGDGYDFPVQVAKCDRKLEQQPKPSRTFLEISGVYHDQFWDWPEEQDQDGSIPIHVPPSSVAVAASSSHASSAGNGNNHSQQQGQQGQEQQGGQQGQGIKFGVGWNSQWHLGKKLPADRQADEAPEEVVLQYQDGQGAGQDANVDSERWIWMTNVWLEDGDSGSGEDMGQCLKERRCWTFFMGSSAHSSRKIMRYVYRLPSAVSTSVGSRHGER